MRSHASHQAFTLIELLVVISIISLLIAILLPALKNARTSAHMASSLTNVRQLQIAQSLYVNDNDGFVTPHRDLTNTRFWTHLLLEPQYINSWKVFWSPSRDLSNYNFAAPLYYKEYRTPGYAVNQFACRGLNEIGLPTAVNPAKIVRLANMNLPDMPTPSKFVSMIEGYSQDWLSTGVGDGFTVTFPSRSAGWSETNPGWAPANVLYSHNGGVVRSYFDGHATSDKGLDLGWVSTSQRLGGWTHSGLGQSRYISPWYRDWENVWYK